MVDPTAQILTRQNGATIAFNQLEGKSPGVVFLGGFMSDMDGSKALALEAHCKKRGQAFLRFDYTGHGQSSGQFADGTIGGWAEDAVDAIEQLTEGAQILVGSSMGGWIMLLVALRLKQRIAGLIGIAAAPDFTEALIENEMTDEQRQAMERDGFVQIASEYDDEPYTITQALIDDGRENLLLGDTIDLTMPVRLIQGMKDEDVPWRTALALIDKLKSDDVEVIFVKDGDHRLSNPRDLERLIGVIDDMLKLFQ